MALIFYEYYSACFLKGEPDICLCGFMIGWEVLKTEDLPNIAKGAKMLVHVIWAFVPVQLSISCIAP